jgi:DNA polymerase III subunit delta'
MPGGDASIGEVLPALERHPRARAVLGPALMPGGRPSHAYLFHGPGGAGKRAAARAVAAELLAQGEADPDDARARVRSGSHPDLTWVAPSGAHEMLVSDIAGPVIAAASKTPFESSRRVFVIERVDELGDESANRMLKTLEEPASFVHLILLTDRLMEVLPTIRSRCQLVRFDAPSAEEIAGTLRREGVDGRVADACARLSLGDAERARSLASGEGTALRAGAERLARATLAGEVGGTEPWSELLRSVKARGEVTRSELEARGTAEIELYPRKERKRIETDWSERARRARRRTETGALDLGLSLVSLWFADLICLELDVPELVRHSDRISELRADGGRDPQRLREAVELVEETRQRFQLNVSEDLACEALCYRLEHAVAR